MSVDKLSELFSYLIPAAPKSSLNLKLLEEKYDDDKFDIIKLMKEAKDPDTGLIRDLKIDDRDLPMASSFYDYATTILRDDVHPPWFFQMWTGLLLFGEVCPKCSNKKIFDPFWVMEHIDKATPSEEMPRFMKILRHGVCPKCKLTKYELIKNHGLLNYTELVNVLGQRSGKSSSAAMYASYSLHRMLKFPRIADHTRAMQKSTELTGTFVSLTASKAIGLLWTPLINIVSESSWFKDYYQMLDHYGNKYGLELYRRKDEYLKFFHKSLRLYPTGPNPNTLRGDTRFLSVIDELGLFPLPKGTEQEDEETKRANADEAHKSLTNSLLTVQTVQIEMLKKSLNCPPALMIGVSSPISMRDKVMRRLADSRTEEGRKYILGINMPTWKANPFIERTTPIIQSAYDTNPEKAERDFGASPPRVHNTFLKPGQVPITLFSNKQTHTITYQYDSPGCLYAKAQKVYSPKYPSIVCLDAGEVNNSFTLVAGHFDLLSHKTNITTVLEVMPHEGRRIDFNLMYINLILPVMKDLNCAVLVADQWQSIDLLNRAKADMGLLSDGKPRCVTKKYSPKRKDFDVLAAMLENQNLILPHITPTDYNDVLSSYIDFRTLREQPIKHLLLQLLTIRDMGEGRSPDKGEGFTDDIVRSLVLSTKIHDAAVLERIKNMGALVSAERSAMPMPVFRPRISL